MCVPPPHMADLPKPFCQRHTPRNKHTWSREQIAHSGAKAYCHHRIHSQATRYTIKISMPRCFCPSHIGVPNCMAANMCGEVNNKPPGDNSIAGHQHEKGAQYEKLHSSMEYRWTRFRTSYLEFHFLKKDIRYKRGQNLHCDESFCIVRAEGSEKPSWLSLSLAIWSSVSVYK